MISLIRLTRLLKICGNFTLKTILIIGIGAGDPDYITVQAIKALNRVDVFFLMDKGPAKAKLRTLRDEICRRLRAQLSLQTGAAALARDEATNEESRARSKYDTHSQEAAYLAEGQGRIAAEIERTGALR